MDGVLNLRKPAGPTSHGMVDEVRRILARRRVGHAGTLDPMATGVLLVCVGRATRIAEYLMSLPKEYRARVVLGQSTDTEDASGQVVEEREADGVTRDDFERACAMFVGEIEQAAPVFSALKQGGVPMYKLARRGKPVERKVRRVAVHSIVVDSFTPGTRAEANIVVNCGSGTYIRSLCADIGRQLDCGAHMGALERTAVGSFRLEDSVTLEELADCVTRGRLHTRMIRCTDALSSIPAAVVDECGARSLGHGQPAPAQVDAPTSAVVRIVAPSGELIGIGEVILLNGEPGVKPRKVLVDAQD